MTADQTVPRRPKSHTRKRAQQPGLTPSSPPLFTPGKQVVLHHYEDGWRWTIVDAVLALAPSRSGGRRRQRIPSWLYTVETVRPYDGKTVTMRAYEWRFRAPLGGDTPA